MRNLLLIILFVVSALSLKAQKQEIPVYREVIVVTKEQTLKFQIKVLKQTISAKSEYVDNLCFCYRRSVFRLS